MKVFSFRSLRSKFHTCMHAVIHVRTVRRFDDYVTPAPEPRRIPYMCYAFTYMYLCMQCQ